MAEKVKGAPSPSTIIENSEDLIGSFVTKGLWILFVAHTTTFINQFYIHMIYIEVMACQIKIRLLVKAFSKIKRNTKENKNLIGNG